MTLSHVTEPDPDYESTELELRKTVYRERIRHYIHSGVFSARAITRKLHNPDDSHFTKRVIVELIKEVQDELHSEWKNRDMVNEVLAFLAHNESLIEQASDLANKASDKEAIAAINSVNNLWKERLRLLGELRKQVISEESEEPASKRRLSAAAKFNKEAEAIEAEWEEVE